MGKCYHSTSGSYPAWLGKITTSSLVRARPLASLSRLGSQRHQPFATWSKRRKVPRGTWMNLSFTWQKQSIAFHSQLGKRKTSFIYSSCSETIQFSNQNVDYKWFSSKHRDQKWSDKFHSQLIYIMEGYASPDHHHTCIGLPCCDTTRTYASEIWSSSRLGVQFELTDMCTRYRDVVVF